jgi:CMP-N-acetylneuraminic acid synthetase
MPKIVALVPMREHSERVENKNVCLFNKRPLYYHILDSLLACPHIDSIYIDTDSNFIVEDAPRHFDVNIIERPVHLRSDFTPMNDILLYDVTVVEADYYLQTHSTNPLLRTQTITAAIEAFLGSSEHDSLFSVTRLQTRLWDADGRAVNHDPDNLLRTQDLPPIYEENSNLYIFTRRILEERRNRIGYRPLLFEIDRIESWDIDDEQDFHIAELLYAERERLS